MTIRTGVNLEDMPLFWEQVGGGVHFAAGLRKRYGRLSGYVLIAIRIFTNYWIINLLSNTCPFSLPEVTSTVFYNLSYFAHCQVFLFFFFLFLCECITTGWWCFTHPDFSNVFFFPSCTGYGKLDELWHFVSKGLVHVLHVKWMCRAGDDSESKMALGKILCLDYIFIA